MAVDHSFLDPAPGQEVAEGATFEPDLDGHDAVQARHPNFLGVAARPRAQAA